MMIAMTVWPALMRFSTYSRIKAVSVVRSALGGRAPFTEGSRGAWTS